MNNENDYNRDEVRRIMEQATLSMTGHPVQIHLRAPIVKARIGQVFMDKDGRFAFDIKPDLSLEVFYETWLHETCHLHRGHCDDMLPRNISPEIELAYSKTGPLLELTEAEEKEYQEDPREVEAETEYHALDHYLRGHAYDRFGNREILSRLRVAMDTQLTPIRRKDE